MANNNNTAGLSQTYIEELTKDVKKADHCHKEYQKAAQKAKNEYDLAKDWEKSVNGHYSKIVMTYGLLKNVKQFTHTFTLYAEKTCTVVGHTKSALDILMECVRCLSVANEELKKSIKDLLDIIESLNQSVLDPNVSIMKCLMDLKAKVEEGIKANLEAVKKMLQLMKCMIELEYFICTPDDSKRGLKNDLKRLIKIFETCEYQHSTNDKDGVCGPPLPAYETPTVEKLKEIYTTLVCDHECGKSTTVTVAPARIDCDEGSLKPEFCTACGTKLQVELNGHWEKALELVCYLFYVWTYFKDREQKAKANYDAAKAALDAAKAAKEKCK